MTDIVQAETARRQIERLGFRRLGRRDQDRYQLNGYSLAIQDGWLTVS